MEKIKNIAIVTFDTKKTDLIEWSYFNKNILLNHNITAMGSAENILEGTLNKKINFIQPGNFGGYRQLRQLIEENKIDAVIIFGEAIEIENNKNLKLVLEAALRKNIIIAANRTTADFVVHSSIMEKDYSIEIKEKKEPGIREIKYQLKKAG
ncbi:MAG: methylglyoxal synthase [Bacteroidetes bacterium]|nr:methylglyoxal synthase [Bacteroidota bacterium]